MTTFNIIEPMQIAGSSFHESNSAVLLDIVHFNFEILIFCEILHWIVLVISFNIDISG